MGGPSQVGICRWASQPDRIARWAAVNGPIPQGMRLGWTCDVPYCDKLEHATIAPDGNAGKRDWKAIRDRLVALKVDEFFDLEDFSGGERAANNLRSTLSMGSARNVKFLIHRLPSGGIRVIRRGTWGSLWLGTQDVVGDKVWVPPTCYTAITGNGQIPSGFYLGFLAFSSLHSDVLSEQKLCAWRGCPYPATYIDESGEVCRRHQMSVFYRYPSYIWRGVLDLGDLFRRTDFDTQHQPHFSITFGLSIDALDRSLRYEPPTKRATPRKKEPATDKLIRDASAREEGFDDSRFVFRSVEDVEEAFSE